MPAELRWVRDGIAVGFVDLHSHVLPGLDDGAESAEASLQMLKGLYGLGFRMVAATPHQRAGRFMPSRDEIRAAYRRTEEALRACGVGVDLALGAENMWDDVFYERMEADTIPSYDDGPAFLVEFPLGEVPAGASDALFQLRLRGKLPVLAHPERYGALASDPALADRLAETAAFVVDLGAVGGFHGRREAKAARALLDRGAAHAAASDAHGPEDVRHASAGMAWIRKRLGEEALARLLQRAPERILRGEHPGE